VVTAALVIVVIGVGTYLTRLSFIGALGTRKMPEWAMQPLRYVAPAVLAALVVPAIALGDGSLDLGPATNPRVLAALLAAFVAWKTRNVAAVIVVGMAALWILQAVF
jgi:branched-subunit amino acid transport protein